MRIVRLSLAAVALMLATAMEAREPIWIDVDAGCGLGDTVDVDDCWALAYALRSDGLAVRGIGTVFGNVAEAQAFATTTRALDVIAETGALVPTVHRGAERRLPPHGADPTAASAALATALAQEPLTIIALGPVTNIATALAGRRNLAARVKRIVAVAGRRPHAPARFFVGHSPLHLHDANFRNDVAAFDALTRLVVEVVLVPFEAAAQVSITAPDLDRLAGGGPLATWLAGTSRGWLEFWRHGLGASGFHPFDLLAVAYVERPAAFACPPAEATIVRRRARFRDSRDDLMVAPAPGGRWRYCTGVDSNIKEEMLRRLAAVA